MTDQAPGGNEFAADRLPFLLRRFTSAFILLICLTTSVHAMTISVHDFGAIGDGRHDDRAAIQAAVDAASHEGPGNEVHLPAGRYLLGDAGDSPYQIVLNHASGLTISGEPGTTLISPPGKTFFAILAATAVTVRSLTLDRDPLAYSQATVTSVDIVRHTARVTINPGYKDFTSAIIAGAKFFVVFNDPSSGAWGEHLAACAWFNPKDPSVCWPPSITGFQQISASEWEVQLNTAPSDHDVGKVVSLWNFNLKGRSFVIKASHDIIVEDIRYYPGGAEGGFVLNQNSGNVTFRQFLVDIRPGSDQLISGVGGSMVFNNHARLTLDRVKIVRVWDDGINMGANYARVAGHPRPGQIEVDRRQANDWQVGDTVALWDWVTKSERARYRLISVSCDPRTSNFCVLTLDRDPETHTMGVRSIESGNNDKDLIDRVIDMESAGTLHAMDSTFQSLHARGMLLHTSNSLIERCEIYDTAMAGILVGPQFYWNEGPVVKDLTIKETTFRNISGSNILVQSETTTAIENKNIYIVNNHFQRYGRYEHGVMGDPATPILIRNVSHAEVIGNEFQDPARRGPSSNVRSEISTTIEVRSK